MWTVEGLAADLASGRSSSRALVEEASDEAYFKWNGRILRNTGLANFLDGCAASLPCHAPGAAPVGLMVGGVAMADRHVLAAARAIETVLAKRRA